MQEVNLSKEAVIALLNTSGNRIVDLEECAAKLRSAHDAMAGEISEKNRQNEELRERVYALEETVKKLNARNENLKDLIEAYENDVFICPKCGHDWREPTKEGELECEPISREY